MTEISRNPEALVMETARGVAMNAAVQASRLVLTYWKSPFNSHFDESRGLEIIEKNEGIGNFATIADIESEKLIIDLIQSTPMLEGHRIIAEESDPVDTGSEYQWIIDPIDGTIPFGQGLNDFGISIGLNRGSVPVLGVIAMPAEGHMIVAEKGKGAQLMDLDGNIVKELSNQQGRVTELKDAVVSYDVAYSNRAQQLDDFVKPMIGEVRYAPSYCSSSACNFRTAVGTLDGFFSKQPTVFDVAAAAAIMTEIGGVVTDISGNPIDWATDWKNDPKGYLAAATPEIHAKILDLWAAQETA